MSRPHVAITLLAFLPSVLIGCGRRPSAHPRPVSDAPRVVRPSNTGGSEKTNDERPATKTASWSGVRFKDVGPEAGLHYRWSIPGKRPLNILQTIGNGCAFLDFDGDSNLDVLLVGPQLALYKGDGHGRFIEVTHETGLDTLYGRFLGCAVGDYDNDGLDDIYISGWRTGILLHNESGKAFRNVTASMGLKSQPWGTSSGFADLDGDGYLDLYVANYVQFDPATDLLLCPFHGVLSGCGPTNYDAAFGILYHGERGQRFIDVTRATGTRGHGKGLGVAFAKFESNPLMGFAVANDLMFGDLFQGRQHGGFNNIGVQSGTAADEAGGTHAGMGVDWGDYDNDGRPDLFVTTFSNETKTLYHNEGYGVFSITSNRARIDKATQPYVSWGCKFFDADNDGWLDLLIASGHVQDNIRRFERLAYREPTVFLHSKGRRPVTFDDASVTSGVSKLPPIVGRGLAVGDYDNDGRVDALIVDSEGRPLLLHNESRTSESNWIGFRLIGGGRGNRNGYGALVRVITNGEKRVRQCHPGGSYLSSSDSRVHFGLGAGKADIVTVWWPDGKVRSWTDMEIGRYHTLRELDDK